jgi:quinol-cytochrome oxidoreductase complex cytochrome b subunit
MIVTSEVIGGLVGITAVWMFIIGPFIDRMVVKRMGAASDSDPYIKRIGITGLGSALLVSLLLGIACGRIYVMLGL